MKVSEPNIKNCVDGDFSKAFVDNEFNNQIYKVSSLQGVTISDVTFDSCIFQGINFTDIKLDGVDVIDVVFENCDLSNQKFFRRYLNRVKFVNCRMTGVSFIEAALKDVQIINCKAEYINLAQANIKTMTITKSNFEHMMFCETKIKNLQVDQVDFCHAEIVGTVLRDVDFSTCIFEGIRIDTKSLQGIIINKFQAYNLVKLLGVIVKE
ncbi:MAG: pentapeptide repeat-containing protein [Clostridia bacterium]|nr:pentapeptide repeat-containing protein [Clostridia bacterium]